MRVKIIPLKGDIREGEVISWQDSGIVVDCSGTIELHEFKTNSFANATPIVDQINELHAKEKKTSRKGKLSITLKDIEGR